MVYRTEELAVALSAIRPIEDETGANIVRMTVSSPVHGEIVAALHAFGTVVALLDWATNRIADLPAREVGDLEKFVMAENVLKNVKRAFGEPRV